MSSKVVIRATEPGGSTPRQLVWRKVKIKKSLDEICHYMELTLPASERDKVHKHCKVEVLCQNPLITNSNNMLWVTTVMVDEVTFVADSSQKNMAVIGRSPARDIIDSSTVGMRLNQTKLEDIARSISAPFGITVGRLPGIPETGPVFMFTWANESPWQKMIVEAEKQGLIFTSNEMGHLYLWKVPNENSVRSEGFFLTEGQNTREIQHTQNGAEQFNEYIFRAGGQTVRETDDTCRNNRTKLISLTETNIPRDDLRRRARVEMLRRRHNRVKATVTGWGLSDEQLRALGTTNQKEIFWNPNFLIPVRIPSIGVNGNLLICQVEYTANPSVMKTDITLVDREAYS